MTIMGINFTKIDVEKKSSPRGKVNISNNVSLTKIEKVKLNFVDDKNEALKMSFHFESKFEPELGYIKLLGDVIFMAQKKKAEELLNQWEKDKKIDTEVMTMVLNNVLNKCNIEALILSKEIGLPAPIPMPKISSIDKNANTVVKEEVKKEDKKEDKKKK
jgi:hypothetical protein